MDIKNETTIKFVAKIVEIVNKTVSNICLMEYVNKTYLDTFFSYCTTLLNSKIIHFYLYKLSFIKKKSFL